MATKRRTKVIFCQGCVETRQGKAHIIFYYGKCSIKKPFSLIKNELDEHFGWPVEGPVEEVNQYFRDRLFAILTG